MATVPVNRLVSSLAHSALCRRGYLFTGAPGSGKTSLVTALAGELGLPVYVLSLTGAELVAVQCSTRDHLAAACDA